MNRSSKRRIGLTALVAGATLVGISNVNADPAISGRYTEAGKTAVVKIKMGDGGRYSINAPSWKGIGFWDATEGCFEGVFHYNDDSGRSGYHRIVPGPDGELAVNWKLSGAGKGPEGSYRLVKATRKGRESK